MLLTRPFPDLNETLQSYVIRLAKANHYSIEQWLQYLAQESVSVRSKDLNSRRQLLSCLYRFTGIGEIDMLFDQWQFYNTDKNFFDYKAVKICPLCIFNNGSKLYAPWTFRYNLCCQSHSCLLVDTCSTCGHMISERCIHSTKCQNCGLPLSEFKVQNVQSDIFSSRISQKISDGILNDRESLLDELSWQYSTLEAFSLLVYEENQANWRNKRGYSLSDKHNHQIAVSRLMENEELLINAIKKYAQGQFEKGTTDLGKALMKFNKYLVDEVNPAILLSVKKLIGWGKFNDQISIGVIFLSKLYGLEQESFKQYLQNHVSTTGFKNRAIPASLAAKVVAEYLEFK